ncbi:uncharacterized protein LOC124261175 [Haliotis rubra]|uniref:uncharacterized protein LOC124261175 n=1 Tax=Haliotis rubra TaxID=36100 RepID=UPI001EE5C9E0|nr:uncharacterized protein LOC124261175 [Haliotis rubra]
MLSLVVAAAVVAFANAQIDPTCVDKLPNCDVFPEDSCKGNYVAWAKENCNNTCKLCIGPTKPPPPCADVLSDCDKYDKSTCTDPTFDQWAQNKCRYYCRLCSAAELAMKDSQTTPIPATQCKDKLNCKMYGKDSCQGQYAGWAKANCMEYCGFCAGVPTPPPACIDKVPNCAAYGKDVCTDPDYVLWVDDHCAKSCNTCGGGSKIRPVPSRPVQAPSLPVQAPSLPAQGPSLPVQDC